MIMQLLLIVAEILLGCLVLEVTFCVTQLTLTATWFGFV